MTRRAHPRITAALSLAMATIAVEIAREVLEEPAFREELKHLARAAMRDPVQRLPVIMTIKELAALYRVSPFTIRRQVQQGTFLPRPFDIYPYRWRRADVLADIKRDRPEQPKRPHGFAATRRQNT
jgi:hypothetical protein